MGKIIQFPYHSLRCPEAGDFLGLRTQPQGSGYVILPTLAEHGILALGLACDHLDLAFDHWDPRGPYEVIPPDDVCGTFIGLTCVIKESPSHMGIIKEEARAPGRRNVSWICVQGYTGHEWFPLMSVVITGVDRNQLFN